jgi:hypothetical protein
VTVPCIGQYRLRGKAAKHRVDEARGAFSADLPGQRDAGGHGGMGRYSIELRHLIGADPENGTKPLGDRGPVPADQRGECGVQCRLAPKYAGSELVGQASIALFQCGSGFVECLVEDPPPGTAFENMNGGAACGGGALIPRGHLGRGPQLSMPRVGLEGTATSRRGMRPAR